MQQTGPSPDRPRQVCPWAPLHLAWRSGGLLGCSPQAFSRDQLQNLFTSPWLGCRVVVVFSFFFPLPAHIKLSGFCKEEEVMILSALSCCEVPVSKSHVEISIHPCKAPQHTVILRFSSPTLAARARNLLIINGDQGKVTAPKTWGASWGSHLEAVGSGSGIAHHHDLIPAQLWDIQTQGAIIVMSSYCLSSQKQR